MKPKTKRKGLAIVIGAVIISSVIFAFTPKNMVDDQTAKLQETPAGESEQCITCHGKTGNGKTIVEQWTGSTHAKKGVSCLDCHTADKNDADAFEHHGKTIATIVTPKDCSTCHDKEYNEFSKSHHADAGMILGSLDNVLAEVVEGSVNYKGGSNPAASSGCWQCHGSKIEVLKDEKGSPKKDENGIVMLDPKTWPNTGIGRINLDGSKGTCSACHNRHSFSVSQARNPENCGKCHMGPDHPQLEIYSESKHGINFAAHKESMNLKSDKWVVGVDYTAAPTCATCHISATPDMGITHDVGDRISWTLRPPVSQKIDEALIAKFQKAGKTVPADFQTWEKRRAKMQNVCSQCHAKNYIDNFYTQYDNAVTLYNDKYGLPATNIYKLMKSEKLLTDIDFDEEIEWTYYFLWHHEGRRARMGASMMGPDYTQWHGFYEVSHRFYTEFVPQARELIEKAKKDGKKAEAEKIEKALAEVMNNDLHKWSTGKENPDDMKKRKEAAKSFRERYEH